MEPRRHQIEEIRRRAIDALSGRNPSYSREDRLAAEVPWLLRTP